jgi:hypothetical protein
MWYFVFAPLGVAVFLYFWGTDWLYTAAMECVAVSNATCGSRMKYWSQLFIDLYDPSITPAVAAGVPLLIVAIFWWLSGR